MKAKIIIILSFILSVNVFSQQDKFQPSKLYIDSKYDEMFFLHIIALPSDNSDSTDIYLCYTFCYISLVFQKTDDDKYYAIPEMEVTFKDSEGITRKRFITNDTIIADNYNATQQKENNYSNVVKFSLANDNYKVVAKFNNSKSRTSTIEHTISKYSDDNKLVNMFLLPCTQTDYFDVIIPYNSFSSNNNCVPFSSNNFTIFIPTKSNNRDYTFTIEKVESKNELNWKPFEILEGIVDNMKERIDRMYSWVFDKNLHTGNTYYFNFKDFITISIYNSREISFIPGKYILTISDNNNIKTQFAFEVKWYNMPKSLASPMYALEQMHLILTDEEYKNMKNKNKNEVFANIMKYWNTRQYRTYSGSNYTTAMIEFFDRVDYAEVNFRTLTQKDGAKSDRGKVYILNGSPNEITTNIKNKKTNEIWYYKKLNKKYIFEIVSVGNYKLVNIEE